MEQKEGKTSPPFSAGYDAGSCKKTDDTQQADEEELTRDRNELPCKNQECQPSVSGKQMTGDKEVSEEDVQDKPPISSSSPLRSVFLRKSRIHPLLPFPVPQQPNKYTISAQSEHNSARLQHQTSPLSLHCLDTLKRHFDFIPFDKVSPCPESSAVVLQSCSTGGKEEQAFQNKPEPQAHSSKLPASSKCNERSKMNSAVEHERTPIGLNLRRNKKFKKDSPSTATINSADYVIDQLSPSALTYRSFRTLGRNKKIDARPLPVHTQSKDGGDHSAPEEMLPPVNVGHTSTESSLSVDSHLQQPSVCSVEQATASSLPSYDMFSLNQMTSSKNKKFPQIINFSNTPTFSYYTVDTDFTEWDCDNNERSKIAKRIATRRHLERKKILKRYKEKDKEMSLFPFPVPQQSNKYTISAQSEHNSARLQHQTSPLSLHYLDTLKRHNDFIPFDKVSPSPESSAVVLQSFSTGGKEEQAFQNKPEPQSHSSKLPASSKCNERSKMKSAVEHERTPITLNLRRKKKFKKDSPSTATINSAMIDQLSPSAFTYRSFRTLGRNKKIDARPLPVHTQSKDGGDHSAPEEMLPPVNVGHTSTENSLCVDSHLQQPSVCSVEQATASSLPSYGMFSLSQMTSSKNKKFPQPINFSNTPTFTDYTVDTDFTEWDCDNNERSKTAKRIATRRHLERKKILKRYKERDKEMSPLQPESTSGGESDAQLGMESLTGVNYSVTNTQPTHCPPQASNRWINTMHIVRSRSPPLLRESTSAKNKTFTQATNFSDTPLKYSTMLTDNTVDTDSNCDPYEHFLSTASAIDSTDYMSDQPLLGDSSVANAAMGVDQDNSREKVIDGTVGPSTLELSNNPSRIFLDVDSNSPVFHDEEKERDKMFRSEDNQSQLMSVSRNSFEIWSECESDAELETEASLKAVNYSVPNTQPTCCPLQMSSDPGWSRRGSSCLLRSLSVPSLSQVTSAKNKTFTRAKSLPDLLLENSFEEFTPDITVDENDEAYWLRCSCPGLYQCRVTGLVFHMKGEGDVVYRIVPWNRRLLAQHHKQPAGPLFDIKCLQQSVCQLHLPHCEICSTGGCDFLSVAHVNDEGIEFITPHEITESHVVINITGFSAFGNVKDADSPPDPVRALVLLFYRPPADPDPTSLLNVLLLPRNVVLQDVLRTRKKLVGGECYIETSPHCKLHPKQEYTLSTCPEDDSVLIQPKDAEFDCDNYDNYFPSFQVNLENILKHLKLLLTDIDKHSVWERQICLSSTGVKRSCGLSILNLPSREKLFDIRSSFIDGISGPVLKSLLDKLFDKKVMTDSERESADEMQNKRDKARFVIDTVSKKGEAASSEMIGFLCETDPFLCEHLGLV